MGVYLELVDHEKNFEHSHISPILINDFDLQSNDQIDKLNSLIFTSYEEDSLEVVPSCDCGVINGEYNVGVKCPECNTTCLSITERPLESVLWIASPQGIAKFMNPEVWLILKEAFLVSRVSVLDWLTSPGYRVPIEKEPEPITRLKQLNMKRGYNHFVENFDSIIDLLINGKVVKKGSVKQRAELFQFIQENRDKIFTRYLPIPSKVAFIKESTNMGRYSDNSTLDAIDAIRTISGLSNIVIPISDTVKESKIVDAQNKLSEYYSTFYKSALEPKLGWFRKHIYGSRVHFSARAVITSISKPHKYDEIELPWSLAVMLLKVHLTSKLLRRGFTPNDAIRYIYEHTLKYDILLDELFQELLSEGVNGRLPMIIQRNPSLTRGSALSIGVIRVKTDPNDNTIGLSVLVLASLNADPYLKKLM